MAAKHSDRLSVAKYPSKLTLPDHSQPYPSLVDYLHHRYPYVGKEVWFARLSTGKIKSSEGTVITPETAYRPGLEIIYYREVPDEPQVPFREKILYRDEHILVVDKPHFLPIQPAGRYVNECLTYRLRATTGNDELVPLHRLDQETAGLVLCSVNPETRGIYSDLFENRQIEKRYEAIALLPPDSDRTEWEIKSRIETGSRWRQMVSIEGDPNSHTRVRLIEKQKELGRFELIPLTGKTHQLRLHMTLIGSQIVGDKVYPVELPEPESLFENPLKLLARRLSFIDPLSGEPRRFDSERSLGFA